MSADTGMDADPSSGVAMSTRDEYDQMLDTLDAAIAEARRKVESGRVRDAENERVRIKWIRALVYGVDVRRKITNDAELAELASEVERLKADAGMGEPE